MTPEEYNKGQRMMAWFFVLYPIGMGMFVLYLTERLLDKF